MQRSLYWTVCDQACHAKACKIIWARPMDSRMFHAFHIYITIVILVSSDFKRFGGAGITDIITESGVVACGSLSSVTSGHHYN